MRYGRRGERKIKMPRMNGLVKFKIEVRKHKKIFDVLLSDTVEEGDIKEAITYALLWLSEIDDRIEKLEMRE